MADSEQEVDFILAIIGNIPSFYHSSDLRRYFSQFIETGGFDCFHFRHRPEGRKKQSAVEGSKNVSGTNTATVKPVKHDKDKTFCCVIKVKTDKFKELQKYYHRHHWQNADGDSIPQLCVIQPIKIGALNHTQDRYLSRKEKKQIPDDREFFTQEDLKSLAELKPPPLMPQGNVGTPTMYFMDQIQKCKLPPSIIRKLGLVFPKQRSNRIYSSVAFDYGGTVENNQGAEEFCMKSAWDKDIIAEGSGIGEPEKKDKEIEEENLKGEDNADNESGEVIDYFLRH